MDAREYKRLRRLILRCFFISLTLIVVAVFLGSLKLRSLNAQFTSQKTQTVKQIIVEKYSSIPGVSGLNGQPGSVGKNGLDGTNGFNGQNGLNITPDQIADAVSAYLQANPPSPGAQGATGATGRAIFERNNPMSGLLECQYVGDLVWQPIAECQ